jgi:hypothetical protein
VPLRAGGTGAAYNPAMAARHLVFAALLACTALQAQTVPAPLVQDSPPLEPRKNQKVERIHHEDAGSIIDEVRYGGQTQSITVQPKANVPEYEIQPTDLARNRPTYRDGASNPQGQRVWNLFRF